MNTETEANNHEKFLSHLDKSANGVWVVARWLNSMGYTVTIGPTTKAKTHKEWKKHADNGDLYIRKDHGPLLRIEAKTRGLNFTCLEDWPHKDFIVCAKHSYDRADPKPYAYTILSNDMKYSATAYSKDYESWRVDIKIDRRYEGVSQEFYVCDTSKVIFREVVY